jgi:hypothetical protein
VLADWRQPNPNRLQINASRKRVHQVQTEWFELDATKNPNVYIQGLPSDITMETLAEFMRKCGIIKEDDKGRPRLKIYRDDEGVPKGDGLCTYLKVAPGPRIPSPSHPLAPCIGNANANGHGPGPIQWNGLFGVQVESVGLALDILDGEEISPGHKIKLQRVCSRYIAAHCLGVRRGVRVVRVWPGSVRFGSVRFAN